MEARGVIGAWELTGRFMNRARKKKRKRISEGTASTRLRGNFMECMAEMLSLPQDETYYILGESTLIHSFKSLKLSCFTGSYE